MYKFEDNIKKHQKTFESYDKIVIDSECITKTYF